MGYTSLGYQAAISQEFSFAIESRILFRELAREEIERYAETREPYDKAGSYAVQGLGTLFIERIEGSYTNVMGLPIEAVLSELGALTGISLHYWFLK